MKKTSSGILFLLSFCVVMVCFNFKAIGATSASKKEVVKTKVVTLLEQGKTIVDAGAEFLVPTIAGGIQEEKVMAKQNNQKTQLVGTNDCLEGASWCDIVVPSVDITQKNIEAKINNADQQLKQTQLLQQDADTNSYGADTKDVAFQKNETEQLE